MKEIIRLENISKTYRTKSRKLAVLSGIQLSVAEGEFTAVIGQSGSGKSTLMNILGCLDRADSGIYYLDGISVNCMNEKEISWIRSRKVGFIFQSFNLIPSMNALENVSLPLMYRRVRRSEREKIAAEALKRVGLFDRMNHLPNEMSGGQQQRTAIARAIAANPKILLADEPTGSLDKKSGEEILSIIKEMNNDGVTVVMITHDNGIAAHADRRICISDGRIIPKD